jgi:hypothetical protein
MNKDVGGCPEPTAQVIAEILKHALRERIKGVSPCTGPQDWRTWDDVSQTLFYLAKHSPQYPRYFDWFNARRDEVRVKISYGRDFPDLTRLFEILKVKPPR